MKVGLILECGPQGADKTVCEYLTKLLDPEIEVISITLDNKPGLIENCADAIITLFEIDKCDRIVVIWDLYPAWRKNGEKPCRKQDRDQILKNLNNSGITNPNVFLVCIEEELETWLLWEHQAIAAVLSRPHRKVDVDKVTRSDQIRNPKVLLNKIFQKHIHIPYSDRIHALQIVKNIVDTNRLRKCDAFVRFALKATDTKL